MVEANKDIENHLKQRRSSTDTSLKQERARADETLVGLEKHYASRADTEINKTRESEDQKLEDKRNEVDNLSSRVEEKLEEVKEAAPHQAKKIVEEIKQTHVETLEKERKVLDKSREIEREKVDVAKEKERTAIRVAEKAIFELERRATDHSLLDERIRVDELLHGGEHALYVREEILATVSHDLRNPLNAIVLAADMIEQADISGADAEEVREDARIIRNSASTMQSLIEKLLQVERFESGKIQLDLKSGDLRELVNHCVAMEEPLAQHKKISLSSKIPEQPLLVAYDSDLLTQAVMNLLGNAVKFTSVGGKIQVSLMPQDRKAIICVSDNGPGIPEEKQKQIFERFQQVHKNRNNGKGQGLGLGLYIATKVINAHGGEIWVESKLGEGSKFYFSLPL